MRRRYLPPGNVALGACKLDRTKAIEPGTRFGLVVVIRQVPGLHGARFLVRCDCGKERYVHGTNLRQKAPTTHQRCGRAAT
jgi:hypothetical protein